MHISANKTTCTSTEQYWSLTLKADTVHFLFMARAPASSLPNVLQLISRISQQNGVIYSPPQ